MGDRSPTHYPTAALADPADPAHRIVSTTPSTLDRRRLLTAGGLGVAAGGLSALLAACGGSGDEGTEPGRVGYAPPATPLATVEVNDAVHLRTATSIEETLIDAYGRIAELGVLDGDDAALLERLVEDHRQSAATTVELTTEAGGEPFECPNPWYEERVLTPIFELIQGDGSGGTPPTDDAVRDALTVIEAMETMVASMYQRMVELLSAPELRADVMELGALAARHAAAVAMRATGTPDGYISPALLGEPVVPDESGLAPLYALPGQFGSITPVSVTIGAQNDAGLRETLLLETPADNSFAYQELACEA